jgi:hypothetical protein
VAKSTVRTHLLRVFEKTGCNRQADLVQLAGNWPHPAEAEISSGRRYLDHLR